MDLANRIEKTLLDRLDELEADCGGNIAQSFVASGDFTATPLRMTFSEMIANIRRRSNALAKLGVEPSDVIAFAAPLSEHSYPMMIAGMVTATLAPVNYFLEGEALIRIIEAANARFLLVHRTFDDGADIVAKLARVAAALPDVHFVSFGTGSQIDGAQDIEAMAAAQSGSRQDMSASPHSREHVVALFHTGGTTGLPKLVPHTVAMYDAALPACGAAQGNTPSETMISGLPLFHTSGALQSGLVPLINGSHVVIPSSRGFRDPTVIANYWNFISRFKISIGASVPTIIAALTAVKPHKPVTGLKRILVGGAPIARATIARIAEMTGGAEVIEGWGMTETCGFSVLNPIGHTKVGSVGLPFPCVRTEIRRFAPDDAMGEVCGVNQTGELVVYGDMVIKRYHDDRPGSFTADGWLKTGDMARIDEDGYFWITGRLKDLIIRSGHNIDPAIIEEPAYQHPAVQLAAAVGRPDKYAGELPVLFVQLKPGDQVQVEELETFVRERIVERAAVPKAVHIVPEIPLSGPGKISKLVLRRRAIEDVFRGEIERTEVGASGLEISVHDDALSGEVVILASREPFSEADMKSIQAALEDYAIPFRWATSGSQA